MSLSDHITKNLICIQVTWCLESKYISVNKHSLASSAHHRSPCNYAGYLLFHEWGKEMVRTASCLNNTTHEHSTASKVAADKKKSLLHTHTHVNFFKIMTEQDFLKEYSLWVEEKHMVYTTLEFFANTLKTSDIFSSQLSPGPRLIIYFSNTVLFWFLCIENISEFLYRYFSPIRSFCKSFLHAVSSHWRVKTEDKENAEEITHML